MCAKEHYHNEEYDVKGRFASYWHQANEILSRTPETVLQVGMGNGFLRDYLVRRGVSVTDLDIDPSLGSDVVGDVREIPVGDDKFDMAVCFEVLEHLPYTDFPKALCELKRVSKKWVIISVPDLKPVYRIFMELPVVGWFRFLLPAFNPGGKEHVEDGSGHYWSVNEKNYPLDRIKGDIERSGLNIVKTYRVFEHPGHRFFVLEK